MFKKRSQGEILVQKPVPAKGVQPQGRQCAWRKAEGWRAGKLGQGSLWSRDAILRLAESDYSVCSDSQRPCTVELWTGIP